MNKCEACGKVYSTPYTLQKHHKRQPLCDKLLLMNNGSLNPLFKDFVNHKIELQSKECKESTPNTTCLACNTVFSNVGNLNRHLATSIICSKWDLYNELEPINAYIKGYYHEFDAPKYHLCHIIWNVFLIDKEMAMSDKIKDIMQENRLKYLITILPEDSPHDFVKNICDSYTIMTYKDHEPFIDKKQFQEQCEVIEEYRKRRENVFVFCNNGYQRSLPFLTYYLYKYHNDEVPSIEKAIDIILPQVDKQNYSQLRDKYIESMNKLFD